MLNRRLSVNTCSTECGGQRSTIIDHRSSVIGHLSTVNRQPSTVNRQPSTVNPTFRGAVHKTLTLTDNRKVVPLRAFKPYLPESSPETKKLCELMPGKALRHRL